MGIKKYFISHNSYENELIARIVNKVNSSRINFNDTHLPFNQSQRKSSSQNNHRSQYYITILHILIFQYFGVIIFAESLTGNSLIKISNKPHYAKLNWSKLTLFSTNPLGPVRLKKNQTLQNRMVLKRSEAT